MMKVLLFLVFCFFGLLHASSRKNVGALEPSFVPSGWTKLRSCQDENVSLVIALKQRNTDLLEKIFWDVSDPQSPNYGKYLTIDEITKIVAPEDETIEKVENWLAEHGIQKSHITLNKDFIHVDVPASKASELLQADFHIFQHVESGKDHVKSLGPYTAPSDVAEHIDFIAGGIGFPVMRKNLRADVGAFPAGPNDLRQRYNVSQNDVGGNLTNRQAVAEFQDQFYSPSDLDQFFQQFVKRGNSKVAKVVGQNDPSDPGVEANLDIQYIMGVAPEVPTWFWSNPNFDFFGDLTKWVNQISDTPNAPWVHSVSYGDQAEGPAGQYKDRLNKEFQKFGVRGISIIFASGDSGTGCDFCFYFEPSFPATSPYVTSVGATRFLNNQVGPEGAVEAFGSGGGFSWHFDQPTYQKSAVSSYFSTETDLPSSHFYNKAGRATPDVAALGIGFQVYVDGAITSVGGTSASAPTFAAIVSLLNEIRLNNNKPTLGFLNPFLYQTAATNPAAFYDVTTGNNQYGCCGYTGFYCSKGWDPVTGLGTPNYAVLSKLV